MDLKNYSISDLAVIEEELTHKYFCLNNGELTDLESEPLETLESKISEIKKEIRLRMDKLLND